MLLSAARCRHAHRSDRRVQRRAEPARATQAPEQVVAFYHELYSRLTAIESVESAGMTSHLPMVDFGWNGEFQIEGDTPWSANQAPLVEYRWMHGEYLKTLAVPLLKGRTLDTARRQGIEHRPHQPGDGRQVLARAGSDRQAIRSGQRPDEVVRGRRRHRQHPIARADAATARSSSIARSTSRRSRRWRSSSERAPTIRPPIIPAARQIVASIDPSLPITQVQTMEAVVARIGGPAAPDVGADGALRRARGAPGDDRRLRRDGLQRPPPAPRVRHPARARRRRVERAQPRRRSRSGARARSASRSARPAPGCSAESSRRC